MSESFRKGSQTPLFIETIEEAISATAAACGGKKSFAVELRPELADDPERAHRWLLDALNHDRRAEFHAEHMVRACRVAQRHGCHILKHWFDDACGYERTDPAPQKTERQKLAEQRLRLAAELLEIENRIAATGESSLRSVG